MRLGRLLNIIEKPGDRILVSINETCQSVVHEVWQYGTQLAQLSSIIALGLVNKNAAEKNLELQKRIGPPQLPHNIPADSPFVSILKRVNSRKRENKNNNNNNDKEKRDNGEVNKQLTTYIEPNKYINTQKLMDQNKDDKEQKKKGDSFKKVRLKKSQFPIVKKTEEKRESNFNQWHCASTTPLKAYSTFRLHQSQGNALKEEEEMEGNINEIRSSMPNINTKPQSKSVGNLLHQTQPPKQKTKTDLRSSDEIEKFYDEKYATSEDDGSSSQREEEAFPKVRTLMNNMKSPFELEKFKDDESVNFVQSATTGLFEDMRIITLYVIDYIISRARALWHSLFILISTILYPILFLRKVISFIYESFQSARWIMKSIYSAIFTPKESFLKAAGFDQRTKGDVVKDSGYPYDSYEVVTQDGYIITLERLPNKNSKDVLYFQHGVIDSGFTWVAGGSTNSLALAAYDQGYDVFLGNFRGNEPNKHQNPKISSAKYWDFSVNEHAFLDMPAFINKIREIKEREFAELYVNACNENIVHGVNDDKDGKGENIKSEDENQDDEFLYKRSYKITAVSHSMGGMATIMYIIKSNLDHKPHYLSHAVLLTPAGVHSDSPRLIRIGAPLISWGLCLFPFIHTLRYPSELIRIIITKIMQDVKKMSPTKDLFTYFIAKIIGGNLEDEHSLFKVSTVQWVFDGTPVGVFRHFYQLISSGLFRAYDYGKKKNLQVYNSPEPINFLDHYDKIDIPMFFVTGLMDTLIPPGNVMKHYSTLASVNPSLAYLKVFPKAGHIDFTYGLDEEMTMGMLSAINHKNWLNV